MLYVGVTRDMAARFHKHSIDKPWWPEVADASIEFLPDVDALHLAERLAIADEGPKYNRSAGCAASPRDRRRTSRPDELISVRLSGDMLAEIDHMADEQEASRASIIRTLIREALRARAADPVG